MRYTTIIPIVLACACAPKPAFVDEKPPSLDFAPCAPAGAECATLEVPIDWNDSSLGTMTLPVLRLRATDPEARVGILAFDFGGPGIPAVARLASLDGGDTPSGLAAEGDDIRRRFDRIAMDRRGVALPCLTPSLSARLKDAPAAPSDDVEWQQRFAAAHQAANECLEIVDTDLLARLDVESAARDLDALRAALREERINIIASSEGTRLGAMYATLFPERARAVVLDSPALADDEGARHVRDQAASFEDAFQQFFAWCASQPPERCRLNVDGQSSPEQIAALVDGLIDLLDLFPVELGGVRVDGGLIVSLLADGAFSPQSLYRLLANSLSRAANGDFGGLATLDAVLDNDTDPLALIALPALDRPFDPAIDEDGLRAFADALALDFPRAAARAAAAEAGNVVWPIRAAHDRTPIGPTTSAPLLLIASRHDGPTPFNWAEQMQDALANDSHLVIYEGVGHTMAPEIECLGRTAVEFLIDPKAPTTTSCPAVIP